MGVPRPYEIWALDAGLIGVLAKDRIAILESDGSLYARAVFRVRKGPRLRVPTGGPVAAPDGHAVVFTASRGNDGGGSSGTETVFELLPGATRPAGLATFHVSFAVCERGVDLSWNGSWVLYHSSEGRVIAVDSTSAAGPIDLSRTVKRLPGLRSEDGGHVAMQIGWMPISDDLWLEPPLAS